MKFDKGIMKKHAEFINGRILGGENGIVIDPETGAINTHKKFNMLNIEKGYEAEIQRDIAYVVPALGYETPLLNVINTSLEIMSVG